MSASTIAFNGGSRNFALGIRFEPSRLTAFSGIGVISGNNYHEEHEGTKATKKIWPGLLRDLRVFVIFVSS